MHKSELKWKNDLDKRENSKTLRKEGGKLHATEFGNGFINYTSKSISNKRKNSYMGLHQKIQSID